MFTLVPSDFFDPLNARESLLAVGPVSGEEGVEYSEIPEYGAVLVYTVPKDGSLPDICGILSALPGCPEYNKIVCSLSDGFLNLAIAQGNNLMIANAYPAPDFTTAEYYVFLAMKSLQLNPEMSTINWKGVLSVEEEISLSRYFKSVEVI